MGKLLGYGVTKLLRGEWQKAYRLPYMEIPKAFFYQVLQVPLH